MRPHCCTHIENTGISRLVSDVLVQANPGDSTAARRIHYHVAEREIAYTELIRRSASLMAELDR